MNLQALADTAGKWLLDDKKLVAMDEVIQPATKRFAALRGSCGET
jgi:hypothetical protein